MIRYNGGNTIIKPTTYIFVDGSNFRQYFNETTQKWFRQEVEFDFQQIKNSYNADKAFYYDCLDDIKTDNETQQQFEKRMEKQEKYLNSIREVKGCHVHLGSLSGKGKKKRQKEVDVLLAVQMMEHAVNGNMQKAILLSGDKDFRPLVETLVRLGIFIEVIADQKHISNDLIHSADSHLKLSIDQYYNWTKPHQHSFRKKNFTNIPFDQNIQGKQYDLIKIGFWNKNEIYLYSYKKGIENIRTFCLTSKLIGTNAWNNDEPKDLEDYFELKYGKIEWKQS